MVEGDQITVKPRLGEQSQSRTMWGQPRGAAAQQHGPRRLGRLHAPGSEIKRRRLSRRRPGLRFDPAARLQPRDQIQDPEGHHDRRREADHPGGQRRRPSARLVRSPPRSARTGGPEPYKGKGVKYEEETIVRKEGKKK